MVYYLEKVKFLNTIYKLSFFKITNYIYNLLILYEKIYFTIELCYHTISI